MAGAFLAPAGPQRPPRAPLPPCAAAAFAADEREEMVEPHVRDACDWNREMGALRAACSAATLVMAVEKRSSMPDRTAVSLVERLAGSGAPTNP